MPSLRFDEITTIVYNLMSVVSAESQVEDKACDNSGDFTPVTRTEHKLGLVTITNESIQHNPPQTNDLKESCRHVRSHGHAHAEQQQVQQCHEREARKGP